MTWKRAVLVLFGLVVAGVAWVVGIPWLLRTDRGMCCEAQTIGDIRTVISAQAAYQSSNGGFYDGRLACLNHPFTDCIPKYPPTSPTFLDSQLASLATKGFHVRAFHPCPPPPAETVSEAKASPSSVPCWVYVAWPEKVGVGGVRSFCGDNTGVIGFRSDGSVPDGVKAGTCELGSPRGWEVLQ